jgi:hypothetical protein
MINYNFTRVKWHIAILRHTEIRGGGGRWCKIGRYWWERERVDIQAEAPEQCNNSLLPSLISSCYYGNANRYAAWSRSQHPNHCSAGFALLPVAARQPSSFGGGCVIANLADFGILPLNIMLPFFFYLFKQDQKFYEIQTAFLIRMHREAPLAAGKDSHLEANTTKDLCKFFTLVRC